MKMKNDTLLAVLCKKHDDGSVTVYRDTGEVFCVIDRYNSSKPDRRFKYMTLNCYHWRIRWV